MKPFRQVTRIKLKDSLLRKSFKTGLEFEKTYQSRLRQSAALSLCQTSNLADDRSVEVLCQTQADLIAGRTPGQLVVLVACIRQ